MKPMPNDKPMVTIDYAAVRTGAAAAPQSEIPWATICWAGFALAMIAIAAGRWIERELQDRKKIKELLKKQEAEDMKLLAEVKRQREEASTAPAQETGRIQRSVTVEDSVGKPPVSVVGAAPAAHAVPAASRRVTKQPVADSVESDAAVPTHDEYGDPSRPYVATANGPISQEVLEVAAQHFRSLSPA